MNCDNWRWSPYYKSDSPYELDNKRKYAVKPIYSNRNYELFGYLAGVRDISVDSFEFDRGMPDNISKGTAKEYEDYKDWTHTPGYCTLKELKAARKKLRSVKLKGYVTNKDYEDYKRHEYQPEYWLEDLEDIEERASFKYLEWRRDNCQLKYLIKQMEQRKREVFWLEWEKDKKKLNSFDKYFRIVFWFDS